MTTFGESHGAAVGVVVDGCPAGLPLHERDIDRELMLRRPGRSSYTSPRKESDLSEILSGTFEGKTTGAPIAIIIYNRDGKSDQYSPIKDLFRPGHANFTYLKKYGTFDYRGGGRSSARETAARVAAGAVAKKLLAYYHIECAAYIEEIGGIAIDTPHVSSISAFRQSVHASPIYCPQEKFSKKMEKKIESIKREGDSLGGVVACIAHLPSGLGSPIYHKLEALLAFAMLSIPASKGFEIGSGFRAARMKGSKHNDKFEIDDEGETCLATNFAGGALGGISTGAPLLFRVAFKPTSSIKKPQQTVGIDGKKKTFTLPLSARHDPCVAIRAVPVVEAMTALVLADLFLLNRCSKI